MNTDTSHISACRTAWFNHQANCKAWQVFDFSQCPTMGAEFHEVCAAITANPSCEHLEVQGCVTETSKP